MVPVSALVLRMVVTGRAGLAGMRTINSMSLLFTMGVVTFCLCSSLTRGCVGGSGLTLLRGRGRLCDERYRVVRDSARSLRTFERSVDGRLVVLGRLLRRKGSRRTEERLSRLSRFVGKGMVCDASKGAVVSKVIGCGLRDITDRGVGMRARVIMPRRLGVSVTSFIALLKGLLSGTLRTLGGISQRRQVLAVGVVFDRRHLVNQVAGACYKRVCLGSSGVLASGGRGRGRKCKLDGMRGVVGGCGNCVRVSRTGKRFEISFVVCLPRGALC